jgi:hypothetical protein
MDEYRDQFIPQSRSIPKIKDSVSLGLVSGGLATLFLDAMNFFSWKNKKSESLYGHVAGSVLMRGFRTKKRNNFVLGQMIHLITGALTGIPLVYIFKMTGKDHQIVKGTAFGSLVYMVYYVFGIRIGAFYSPPKHNKSHLKSLWLHLLFGIIASKAVITFGHPSLFSRIHITRVDNQRLNTKIDPWTPQYDTKNDMEKTLH